MRWLLALIIFPMMTHAQWSVRYTSGPEAITSAFKAKTSDVKDSASARKYLSKVQAELLAMGYINHRLDWSADSTKMSIKLKEGDQYQWSYFSLGNVEESFSNAVGLRARNIIGKQFSPNDVFVRLESILEAYENNGYPFASIGLDSVSIDQNKIAAAIRVDRGPLILIDSINVVGKSRINRYFLGNYLDIKKGRPYNEQTLRNVQVRILELPYLTESKQAEVVFKENKAEVQLYLEDKKANDVNGIIGFLPDRNTGRINVTGDVKVSLLNALNQGEQLKLNWRKLQANTQDLKVDLKYPFIFRLPIGLRSNVFLYRRDTLFSSSEGGVWLDFRLNRTNYLLAGFTRKASNIISSAGLSGLNALPEFADFRLSRYVIGGRSEQLDYRYNPRKGYTASLDFGAGNRRIIENPNLNPELYDSLQLRTIQYSVQYDLSAYFPLLKRSVVKLRGQGGHLFGQQIFRNELFRLGGIRTIRGFDIESLEASTYVLLTVEYRYLLEQNSFLYLFSDFGYYENISRNNRLFDQPVAFGAGLSFDTRTGVFSINYAIGSQKDNPFLFRSSKVHFGFVNFF